MQLTNKQKNYLRKFSHNMSPIVIIGQQGLSENVMSEIELAINFHELIKVRVNAADREHRQEMIEAICARTNSASVQCMGHIATFYRVNPEKQQFPLPKN